MPSTISRPQRSPRRSAASPAIRRSRGRSIRPPSGTTTSGASGTTACRPVCSSRTGSAGARGRGVSRTDVDIAIEGNGDAVASVALVVEPLVPLASLRLSISPFADVTDVRWRQDLPPGRRRPSSAWRSSTPTARRRKSRTTRSGTRRTTSRPARTSRRQSPASRSTTCRRPTTGASTRTCTTRCSPCCCRVRSPPASASCWRSPTRRSWWNACATPPATCSRTPSTGSPGIRTTAGGAST